jgi:hypothetical protein
MLVSDGPISWVLNSISVFIVVLEVMKMAQRGGSATLRCVLSNVTRRTFRADDTGSNPVPSIVVHSPTAVFTFLEGEYNMALRADIMGGVSPIRFLYSESEILLGRINGNGH